jgi:hypothetical protein
LIIGDKKEFPEKKDDFVLKIDDQNIKTSFLGPNSVFYFTDTEIFEIKSKNKQVLQIIKRAFLKKYTKQSGQYSQKRETSLSPDEIFEINTIQKELRNIFNITTNLPELFKISEISDKKEVLEINYQHGDNFIEIIPYLDYKIKKVPISDSIKFNKKKLLNPFYRKFSDELGFDYLIKIEKDVIL